MSEKLYGLSHNLWSLCLLFRVEVNQVIMQQSLYGVEFHSGVYVGSLRFEISKGIASACKIYLLATSCTLQAHDC